MQFFYNKNEMLKCPIKNAALSSTLFFFYEMFQEKWCTFFILPIWGEETSMRHLVVTNV